MLKNLKLLNLFYGFWINDNTIGNFIIKHNLNVHALIKEIRRLVKNERIIHKILIFIY